MGVDEHGPVGSRSDYLKFETQCGDKRLINIEFPMFINRSIGFPMRLFTNVVLCYYATMSTCCVMYSVVKEESFIASLSLDCVPALFYSKESLKFCHLPCKCSKRSAASISSCECDLFLFLLWLGTFRLHLVAEETKPKMTI